jgi:D-glycero-D-manno-heptose 1,7-bisphosphate phosphatase
LGRPAVFVDRDGTLIADPGYLSDPGAVRLMPGAAAAIARLNRAGYPVILVTNQSGIGRGMYDEAAFQAVQRRVEALLADAGARVDATYFCPHAPDRDPPCDCRKPEPGLFLRAANEHGLDLSASYFIGDRARDVEPAARWGAVGILVGDEGAGEPPPGVVRAASLEAAVALVPGTAEVDVP